MNIDTAEISDLCAELRERGCAVVCFAPDELRGADRINLEDRMTEYGWDVIDSLATEPIEDEWLDDDSDDEKEGD